MPGPFKEQPGDHCGRSRVSKGENLGEQIRMALKDSGFYPKHQGRHGRFWAKALCGDTKHWSELGMCQFIQSSPRQMRKLVNREVQSVPGGLPAGR